MQIRYKDYNNAGEKLNKEFYDHWEDIRNVLEGMPLHLKESDQAGLQGNLIFDPVGTNEYIKSELINIGWESNISIPAELNFLGKDIDFWKSEVITEVQFSNYPFLLNNLLRTEIFYKSKIKFSGYSTKLLLIVTKAKMFPASNSTLYYEQAEYQLNSLLSYQIFDVPIRLVGLFESIGGTVPIKYTRYHTPRYSRTSVSRTDENCRIISPKSSRGRCSLEIV